MPNARDRTRLDGARDNKQVWSLAPPCSNLRSFGSKCTVLKKVLVILLGLFGAPRNDSAPPWWFGARGIVPPFPPHCTPAPYIHKLQSCINTAISPKVLSWACYVSTTKHYDKTVVLWLDITRGSDIVTEQERSLAISTSPRLSHQGCQIGHFMANFEKFGHFLSALAMIKRIWPFCKIWLFFDHIFGLSL